MKIGEAYDCKGSRRIGAIIMTSGMELCELRPRVRDRLLFCSEPPSHWRHMPVLLGETNKQVTTDSYCGSGDLSAIALDAATGIR